MATLPTMETDSEHQVAVAQDRDGDFLTDREEIALGYRAFTADQNHHGVADETEPALRCVAAMDKLPPHIQRWEKAVFGLECCDICGEAINMGLMGIINQRLDLEVEFPIIALPYLEHGAFGYAGEVHNGRVDVPRLARALELRFPCEPADLNQDCRVDIEDFTEFAERWLDCIESTKR